MYGACDWPLHVYAKNIGPNCIATTLETVECPGLCIPERGDVELSIFEVGFPISQKLVSAIHI